MESTTKTHADEPLTGTYKEPAPPLDRENPLESMMKRFDIAAEILGLERGVYEYLKSPAKQVIVSIPIPMDDGRIQVFEGYRVIHNDVTPSPRIYPNCSMRSTNNTWLLITAPLVLRYFKK